MEKIEFKPLTIDLWNEFETLFGDNGADGGCWCMFFRITGKEFSKKRGLGTKQEMKLLVQNNSKPGILAFVNGVPAGWCSIAPRDEFTRINRSPILKKVDEKPVWSIVCYFIDKKYRKQKLSEKLLSYAINYAKEQGARIIEGYPKDKKNASDAELYVGVYETYQKMGFEEVARRKLQRPIMRYYLK